MKESTDAIIRRIELMERLYDEVSQAVADSPTAASNDPETNKKLAVLTDYLTCGLWLRDFEYDERGYLPRTLKRGVLSEDGLYDLVTRARQDAKFKD